SVAVVTMNELEGQARHYAELLEQRKLPLRSARLRPLRRHSVGADVWALIRALPSELQSLVFALLGDLEASKPDILPCWLDQPDLAGGLAGLMAGVPNIILSTRNSNPTNFPRLLAPYQQPWYKLLAQSSRVHFIANSHSGAVSYADWLGIPSERFHVVFNG